VKTFENLDLKREEKQKIRNRFIIIMKRIILGKAKAEDLSKESSTDNFYSNSIVNNFLSDILGRTKDDFINNRMKVYRNKIIEKKQRRKFPHVFTRMNDDVKRRQVDILPKDL